MLASRLVMKRTSAVQLARPVSTLIAADQNIKQFRVYHKSHYAALALVPAAFLAPKALALPLDLALAVVLPVHAHMGMNFIFTDYVPGAPDGPARVALLAASILASLGLIKLSFTDKGVAGSVKALWAKEEKK